MPRFDEPSAAQQPINVGDPVREQDLERVLEQVPRGAWALCGLAMALVLLCWLAIYFGVFLPRGPVS
jgi:hypothetical protein